MNVLSSGNVDAARRAAYDLQHAVNADGAYANLAWPQIVRKAGLTGRDSAFATELGYGTLRWRGLYDPIIAAQLDRPIEKLDPMLLDVLRLGTHQLLGMRVSTHAAVNESVNLAKSLRGEGAGKLTNAVLRKVATADRGEWIAKLAPDQLPEKLEVATSHPAWILSAYRDALSCGWDELAPLLAIDNEPGKTTLVARDISVEELLADTGGSPGRFSEYAVVLESGAAEDVAAVRDGRAGVQDEGSQLTAIALANAPIRGADTRWLDLTAGPGGKAALLAALAKERGATLTAVEVHPHRADLVRAALARYDVEVICADATDVLFDNAFDRVLVDVPCSGIGVVRRRPDLRWRRSPSDVGRLAPLQRELLSAALRAVRAGGVVAYVTCSPHIAETELVVDDVLKAHPDVEREDARTLFPGVPNLGEGPDVRLWPHLHGTDGMYFALLRRTQ